MASEHSQSTHVSRATSLSSFAKTFPPNRGRAQLITSHTQQPVEMWIRIFPKPLGVVSALPDAAEKGRPTSLKQIMMLNAMYPQAGMLKRMSDTNINRFVGLCLDMDSNDALLLYEFGSKGPLRRLIRNQKFLIGI